VDFVWASDSPNSDSWPANEILPNGLSLMFLQRLSSCLRNKQKFCMAQNLLSLKNRGYVLTNGKEVHHEKAHQS
jgi:hypothetical protein